MPAKIKKEIVPFTNEIIVLVGPPGSGKSTLANVMVKTPSYIRINRDDTRKMVKGVYVVSEEVEELVSKIQDADIRAALAKGYNVVLDNTHCKVKYIKDIITKYGKLARISVKIVGAELSIKQIKENNLKREKAVPEEVIDRMYKGYKGVIKDLKEIKKFIEETASGVTIKQFNQDPSLPKAIIVDIDGTIAHMGDRRSPYDWHKVGLDEPDHNILNIVRALSGGYKVFFVSGRDEICRPETEEWLNKHYLLKEHPNREWTLLMRPQGNFEKDSIIKERIFEENFKDKYYIELLFDDRNQVVDKYRSMGLKVAQVAEGDF